jgi:hypothetical protein
MEAVILDQHIGVHIPGANNLFKYLRPKSPVPFIPARRNSHGHLNGVIESKKSAEWWNVINGRNREWSDSPSRQKSKTQPHYDLVQVPSSTCAKTRTRLRFLACAAVLIGASVGRSRPHIIAPGASSILRTGEHISMETYSHLAVEPFHASFVKAVPEKTVCTQRSKLSYTREAYRKLLGFLPTASLRRSLFRLTAIRIGVVFLHGFAKCLGFHA